MGFDKHDEGPFRVIRWRPGIRGIRRWFDLRTMTRDDELWFVCQDVQKALGWSRQELGNARRDRLDGNTWGTTYGQWFGQGPQLAYISLHALNVVMEGRRTRHNRAFLRWLNSLEEVDQPGDAVDFVDDLPTDAEHSTGAYLTTEVDHAFA